MKKLTLVIALLTLCSTLFASEDEATIVFMRSSVVGDTTYRGMEGQIFIDSNQEWWDYRFQYGFKKFEKWKSKTKPVTTDDKARAWYEAHKDSVEEKRTKYWQKWQRKSAAELSERTLLISDGERTQR